MSDVSILFRTPPISKAYNGAQHLPYRINMMNEWASFIDDAYAGKVDIGINLTLSVNE